MERLGIHITVTNVEFYDVLKSDAAEPPDEDDNWWTVGSLARRGDVLCLYVCKPVMAIVAVAYLATAPVFIDDPADEWFKHYRANIQELRLLRQPVTRTRLIDEIPAWGWPRQPRSPINVPGAFVARLMKMLEQ